MAAEVINCVQWAHRYPRFSAWMLYGEVSGAVQAVQAVTPSCPGPANSTSTLSGLTMSAGSMGGTTGGRSTLSPVLIAWMTLVLLYLVNCTADNLAASAMQVSTQCNMGG